MRPAHVKGNVLGRPESPAWRREMNQIPKQEQRGSHWHKNDVPLLMRLIIEPKVSNSQWFLKSHSSSRIDFVYFGTEHRAQCEHVRVQYDITLLLVLFLAVWFAKVIQTYLPWFAPKHRNIWIGCTHKVFNSKMEINQTWAMGTDTREGQSGTVFLHKSFPFCLCTELSTEPISPFSLLFIFRANFLGTCFFSIPLLRSLK